MSALFAWFFLSLRGRISRQEFWLGYLLMMAVLFLFIPRLQDLSLAVHQPANGNWHRDELDAALLRPKIGAFASMLWPLIALYVKRLHDIGASGWWLFVAAAALLFMTMIGIDPRNYVGAAFFAVVGLARGTRGDNRFGPDPIHR